MDFEALPQVIAIVGSRDFTHLVWVEKFVNKLKPQTVVVSGGARGVDRAAKRATERRKDLFYKPFHVEDWEWEVLGKNVGIARNFVLVRWVGWYNGHVVLFVNIDRDGEVTSGARSVIHQCEKQRVPYTLFTGVN